MPPIHSFYTIGAPLLLFVYLTISLRKQIAHLSLWLPFEIGTIIGLTWAISQAFWDPLDHSLTVHAFPFAWVWLRMPQVLKKASFPNPSIPFVCASLCWFQILCVDLLQVGVVLQQASALSGVGGAGFLDGLLAHPLVLFFVITLFYLQPPAPLQSDPHTPQLTS